MGADMVMAIISFRRREGDDKNSWDSEFHKRIEAVRKVCKAGKWFDDANGIENFYDAVYGDPEKPRRFENAKDEVMAEFLMVIEEFEECFRYRDVGTYSYPERLVIFSGGMSHGEPSTESYSKIDKFVQLPLSILEAGGFE